MAFQIEFNKIQLLPTKFLTLLLFEIYLQINLSIEFHINFKKLYPCNTEVIFYSSETLL